MPALYKKEKIKKILISEGIVIRDAKVNQFMWLPIGEGLVTDENKIVTFKSGRYKSFELDEEPPNGATEINYGSYGSYIRNTRKYNK